MSDLSVLDALERAEKAGKPWCWTSAESGIEYLAVPRNHAADLVAVARAAAEIAEYRGSFPDKIPLKEALRPLLAPDGSERE